MSMSLVIAGWIKIDRRSNNNKRILHSTTLNDVSRPGVVNFEAMLCITWI